MIGRLRPAAIHLAAILALGVAGCGLLDDAAAPEAATAAPTADAAPLSAAEVREAQRLLNRQGFETGGIDGVVGPKTRLALIQFQQRQGLPETGQLSADLLERLRTADARQPAAAKPAAVRRGTRPAKPKPPPAAAVQPANRPPAATHSTPADPVAPGSPTAGSDGGIGRVPRQSELD